MLSNEPLPHGELPLPFAIEILRCIEFTGTCHIGIDSDRYVSRHTGRLIHDPARARPGHVRSLGTLNP